MPLLYNDALDDPILLDGNDSFVGGQVSATRANLAPQNAYVEGKNVDLDEFGNVVTRRGAALALGYLVWESASNEWESESQLWNGVTAPITGAAYFDVDTAEKLVLADGSNSLKISTESGVYATISGSSIASGATVQFAQLVNRLYYADGDGDLRYIDSAGSDQSISAGRITSVEITKQGDGYTSVPTVTFSSGSAASTAKLGYGGKVVEAEVTSGGSGYSTTTPPTITFSAPSSGTTAEGIAKVSQTPPKPKLLVAHTNRLFCTSADTGEPSDKIFVSDILDGESFDLIGNSIRVGGGDGDPVVALLPWFDHSLLIFKQRSIWVVDANPAQDVTDWQIRLINNRVGCVAARTVQQVGSDVLFMSRDGVRSVKTIESGAQTDISQPISSAVNDVIGRINQSEIGKCCAVYWRNRYLLAVPLDSDTNPSVVLCFHLLSNAWVGSWTGWQPRDWVITAFAGKLRLNFADQSGRLYTWDDYTAEDNTTADTYKDGGSDYESYIKTRAYRFGETWGDKVGHSVQFDFENIHSTSQSASLTMYKDLSDSGTDIATSVAITANTGLERKGYNLTSRGRFNQLQFKAGVDAGRMALHSVQASAFGQPIRAER
tara:strand:- start:2328 stop:4142 length:1815 start_codon:yes stop_codon:yes gene_type:complete